MGTTFRVDTATAPPERVLFDVQERLITSASGVLLYRRGFLNRTGTPVGTLLAAVGVTQTFIRLGSWWYRATSAVSSVLGRAMQDSAWPMGYDQASLPLAARLPAVWIASMTLNRVTQPILANTPCWFGFNENAIQWIGDGSNFAGVQVSSISTENGGNWAVKHRLVNGGALVSLDTGILANTIVRPEIEYEDTTAPVLRVRVNGVEFLELSGLANVPRLTTNAWVVSWGNSRSVGGTAGQVDEAQGFRLQARQLAGYPE